VTQRDLRSVAGAVALVAGLICAAIGSFIGYAASATNTYGWVLRLWAIWSMTGFAILAGSLWLGPMVVRIAAAILLFTLGLVGIDPAQRLSAIGWAAP